MKLRSIAFVVVLLCNSTAFVAMAASYKIEPVSTVPAGLSSSVKALLQPEGYKVVNEQGKAWCEVWIRKEISNLSKPASPDAKYPALHLGQLLGAMSFSAAGADYRGQSIARIYTCGIASSYKTAITSA